MDAEKYESDWLGIIYHPRFILSNDSAEKVIRVGTRNYWMHRDEIVFPLRALDVGTASWTSASIRSSPEIENGEVTTDGFVRAMNTKPFYHHVIYPEDHPIRMMRTKLLESPYYDKIERRFQTYRFPSLEKLHRDYIFDFFQTVCEYIESVQEEEWSKSDDRMIDPSKFNPRRNTFPLPTNPITETHIHSLLFEFDYNVDEMFLTVCYEIRKGELAINPPTIELHIQIAINPDDDIEPDEEHLISTDREGTKYLDYQITLEIQH